MKSAHLIHLYNRIGFGITPKKLNQLQLLSKEENLKLIFKESKKHKPLKVDKTELNKIERLASSEENKRKEQKENRNLLRDLNKQWFHQLNNSETLLHDKMRLFWANHFVCSSQKIRMTEEYLRVIEKHALGNFKDFVLAISQNPAMIRYLNNQQNKKKHPNENYARELMELFTLGIGHYTEDDIKESARAFTGWSSNKNGFVFKAKFHDSGKKTFMGKTGYFDGKDIIKIILKNPQCALFISEKIYKEFVNPIPNKHHIKKMAKVFEKNYEIEELMNYTLSADWFYDNENIGAKIKSPVELLVGIHNVIPFKYKKDKYFLYLQYNLGQKLLYPPNVAGWPGNRQWIDANTIMIRLKLASTIAQQRDIELAEEHMFEDDFETINKRNKRKQRFFPALVNWQKVSENTQGTTHEQWQHVLIGQHLNSHTKDIVKNAMQFPTKDFCITIMSLPEYQMC